MERADYSLAGIRGLTIPVPMGPAWFISDTVHLTAAGAYSWLWSAPPDNKVWSITDFVFMADELTWMAFRIKLNDEEIFYQYHGYPLEWHPANERAVRLTYPDVLLLTMAHVTDTDHWFYWCMNFFTEPQG